MKIGLFSVGLDTYWPQFNGLFDRLHGYHCDIRDRLSSMGVDITDAGMVDSVPKAQDAASLFRRNECDLIVLFLSTYALSSTVLPIVQKAKVPVLKIGNTNSRYRLPIGAKTFLNEWSAGGPSHHCAIGTGHIAGKIEKLGALLGLAVRKVC